MERLEIGADSLPHARAGAIRAGATPLGQTPLGGWWRGRHESNGLVRFGDARAAVGTFAAYFCAKNFCKKMIQLRAMKNILLLCLAVMLSPLVHAQTDAPVVTNKKLKVVFQLTTGDTLAHKALVKQLNNFLVAAPNAKLEVVCHNNGITFLQTDKTKQASGISALKAKGVDFVACENTLRERKIKREELMSECRTVPAGVVEVVLKQDAGWAYIKAGL